MNLIQYCRLIIKKNETKQIDYIDKKLQFRVNILILRTMEKLAKFDENYFLCYHINR